MDIAYLIFLPVLGYLLLSYFVTTPTGVKRPWFEPSKYIITFGWVLMYFILGYLLYRARHFGLNSLVIKISLLVFFTYIWGILYDYNNKYSVITVILTMILSYAVYNEIFLSEITMNERTFELDLIATYILWTSYMLSIILSSKGQYEGASSIV